MSGIQTIAALEAIVIPSNALRSELTGWNMSGAISTSRRTWPRRRQMALVTSASSQKAILFLSPAAYFLEQNLDPARIERRSWSLALATHALSSPQPGTAEKILRRNWPQDSRADVILKTAMTPLSTADFPPVDDRFLLAEP